MLTPTLALVCRGADCHGAALTPEHVPSLGKAVRISADAAGPTPSRGTRELAALMESMRIDGVYIERFNGKSDVLAQLEAFLSDEVLAEKLAIGNWRHCRCLGSAPFKR